MPPVGFEPKISAGERPQTYALDRAATGTGPTRFNIQKFYILLTLYLRAFSYGFWFQYGTFPVQNRNVTH